MKKKQHAAANHERWLISYADFITLLFAFFVVMFATSQADKSKAKRLSEAFEQAFDGKPAKSTASGPLLAAPPMASHANTNTLESSMQLLSRELATEIKSGTMRLSLEHRGLVVSLSQATFFPSGTDSVDEATFSSLEKVALVMLRIPNPVRLEGHTDSRPIHTERFRSNWDLSASRAIAVLDLLRDRFHISTNRLAVAGYADSAPVDSNDTEIGRARNRRVDLVILNDNGNEKEPHVNLIKPKDR